MTDLEAFGCVFLAFAALLPIAWSFVPRIAPTARIDFGVFPPPIDPPLKPPADRIDFHSPLDPSPPLPPSPYRGAGERSEEDVHPCPDLQDATDAEIAAWDRYAAGALAKKYGAASGSADYADSLLRLRRKRWGHR